VIKNNTLILGEWYGELHLQPPASVSLDPKAHSITFNVGPDTHQINVVQRSTGS